MSRNSIRMSQADYNKLLAHGKHRGVVDKCKPVDKKKGKVVKITPQVEDICAFLTAENIPHITEHRFHETRRWRFDIAIPSMKIAIEYEGVYSKKSRHTSKAGYTKDVEKYNAATALGWRVLRYTHKNYTNFYNDLKTMI